MADEIRTYFLTATEVTNLGLDSSGNNITIWEWPDLDKWAGCKHTTKECDMEVPDPVNALPLFTEYGNEFWEGIRLLIVDDRLDGYEVDTVTIKEKKVWYCESPCCRHRENDRGHNCYWCDSKEV